MRASLGSLAAGGTLGILIPPSVNMIVYGSLTNNSIGKLFIAGIIPGLLLTGCFMLWILISSLASGNAIREAKVPLDERIRSLVHLVPPLVVFGIVMGSLYFGIATAAESAALGVIAALGFTWHSGKLDRELLRTCFISTARVSGMILLIIAAAFILNLTISLTGVAEAMTKWVAGLGLSATGLILALIVFYLILGMFMDVLSMQVATIPITYPIAIGAGRGPDLVRHLHRAHVRAGTDHAAGGHEPVRGARHPAGQGGHRGCDLWRAALCAHHDPVHAADFDGAADRDLAAGAHVTNRQ